MADDTKSAFVAMKFDSDPWNDRRYNIMREVMEDAGYEVTRGDEIRTSGNVVDEVCRRLKESDPRAHGPNIS